MVKEVQTVGEVDEHLCCNWSTNVWRAGRGWNDGPSKCRNTIIAGKYGLVGYVPCSQSGKDVLDARSRKGVEELCYKCT